jgi:hypothetical protein
VVVFSFLEFSIVDPFEGRLVLSDSFLELRFSFCKVVIFFAFSYVFSTTKLKKKKKKRKERQAFHES